MRRTLTIFIAVACILASSCRSYYPASSEKSYQECVNSIKTTLAYEGYTLDGQSREGGYHDKETYSFANADGEKVQFTLEVHRGENDGEVFIDEVIVQGCSTTNAKDYERYCGENGVPAYAMKRYLKKDVTGSKFSPGKTVGAVIFGSFALGVLIGLLEVAAMKSVKY